MTDADRSAELEGKDPKRLTIDIRIGHLPGLVTRRHRIAFSRDGRRGGIFTMDADGRNVDRVTEGRDQTPAWSPDSDGSSSARTSTDRTARHPDGRGGRGRRPSPLGDDLHGAAPAWSPDGRRCLLPRRHRLHRERRRPVRAEDRRRTPPRFMPDGSLLFGARGGRDGTWQIVRWDDGDVTTVVDTPRTTSSRCRPTTGRG